MPAKDRPRHALPPALVRLLSPFFRYSVRRNAYVLRVIGTRGYGPVLKPRKPAD